MNIGSSIRKAIDDWELGDFDAAMLHACNAIDGTAKKSYPLIGGNKARFTQLLRDSYAILGPMGVPGIDLIQTRFPVRVERPTASGGEPDIADVIYAIHRCCHAHGEALPAGFELIPDASGPARRTRMHIERGKLQLSDRIIFGLLGVAVFSSANTDQRVPDSYFLTFGGSSTLVINEWWGRADDFLILAAQDAVPLVKLDFSNWVPLQRS